MGVESTTHVADEAAPPSPGRAKGQASLLKGRRRLTQRLLALPVIWLIIFFVVPVALVALYSVGLLNSFERNPGYTWQAWGDFFTGGIYMRLFWRSLRVAIIVSVVVVVLAYPIAYFLSMVAAKYKYALLILMITPFLTNFFLRIMAWKVILADQGLVNNFLFLTGLRAEGNPLDIAFGPIPVMIVLTYVWIPFVMLPIFASLISVDRDLLEAANDLGASRWRAFWQVTFPLSLPGIGAAFFFVFIPTIGEFVVPLFMGGPKGYMFGSAINDLFGISLNWRTGSVLSLWLVMVVFAFAYVFMKFVKLDRLADV